MNRDEELVILKKIANGDKRSFEYLFRLYFDDLYLISSRIVNNKCVAEEIVQDFFVKFWLRRKELCISYSFRAYSYRSVYNCSLNYLRDNKRFVQLEDKIFVEEDLDSGESEEYAKAIRLLESLPLQCRRIFTLIAVEGLSYADAAKELGLSVNTVKVQMSKAYRTLRSTISLQTIIYLVIILS